MLAESDGSESLASLGPLGSEFEAAVPLSVSAPPVAVMPDESAPSPCLSAAHATQTNSTQCNLFIAIGMTPIAVSESW
jgi:hypothetical protein